MAPPPAGPAAALSDVLFEEPETARCLLSADGIVLRANHTCRQAFNSNGDLVGTDIALLDVATAISWRALLSQAGEGATVAIPAHSPTRFPGGPAWSGTLVPVATASGTVVLLTLREVGSPPMGASERLPSSGRVNVDAMRLDAMRLEALITALPVGIIVVDSDGRISLANAQAQALLGGVTGDAAGPDGGYTLHRPDGAPFSTDDLPLVRALAGEPAPSAELMVRRGDGTERTVLSTGTSLRDDSGAIVGAIAVLQDVTERRRAEAAVQQSERRYRTLFENMTEGFALGDVILDDRGAVRDVRLLEMNAAFERQTGLTRQQALGRPMREVLPSLERSWIDIYGGVALGAPSRRLQNYNADLDRHFSLYCYSPSPGTFAVLFTDITGRKQFEDALAAALKSADDERQRLAAVLHVLPAGVAIADVKGRVTLANDALRRIWGGPPKASTMAEYGEWRAWWPETGERVAAHEFAMARALTTGATIPGDILEIERFDGSGRATIINAAAPIRNGDGVIIGGVVAEIDITAQKRAEAALREADRRKDEFIAILSHELRNPLSPIRFAIPVLERELTSEAGRRALAIVRRQCDHLARLVDDLLDASRISRGKLDLHRQPITLESVVAAAVEAAAPLAAAARHELIAEVDAEPIWVDADAARLTQVLTNLLNNSARYTPRGGRIHIRATREGATAIVRVTDTGIGLPADAVAHLFNMFHQVDRHDQPQGGLGIGLALSKRLIDMHGGSIEARSEGVGHGAEFIVRLPAVTAPLVTGDGDAARPLASRPLTVLIVDDNADLVDLLADIVAADGHTVRKALDGESALAAATAASPDVVLLDIGLPLMNGLDVARELRRRRATARAVLIAMTGWGQPEDRQRTTDAGFDHHLTKPVRPETLLGLLADASAGAPPSDS